MVKRKLEKNFNFQKDNMYNFNFAKFLKAGVHFGHSTSKWNPKINHYLLMQNQGIDIIDLYKTKKKLYSSCLFLKKITASGKIVLFVGTKEQAKQIIAYYANTVNMPYINARWFGGLLTNFSTIQESIYKMNSIKQKKDAGFYNLISKKERLLISRLYTKLKKNLGSVSNLNLLPSCLVIIDINKEQAAVKEALTLGIPIVGIVDTNSDPEKMNFPIVANDDNSKSINLILYYLANSIANGVYLYLSNKKHILCKTQSSKILRN
ncbi:30S ribosomal protein S2 [Candidatus Karelsulcia muelleri]